MNILNVSVTPQKTTKLGNYPVYNERDLECTANVFNLPRETMSQSLASIETSRLSLRYPPDENYVDGYICGIYQRIDGQTGLNWSQSTSYSAYTNPVYWSALPSRNEWIRSDNIMLFNVYDNNDILIRQEIFNDVNFLLYDSGRYKQGCNNKNIVRVRQADLVVEILEPFTLPPNEFGLQSNDMIIQPGTYDLANAPGCECDNCPGTIILAYSKSGPYRYLLGGFNGFGSCYAGPGSSTCQSYQGYNPCLIVRQKCSFCDCGAGSWNNTGSYVHPPDTWNLCEFGLPVIPACAFCE